MMTEKQKQLVGLCAKCGKCTDYGSCKESRELEDKLDKEEFFIKLKKFFEDNYEWRWLGFGDSYDQIVDRIKEIC